MTKWRVEIFFAVMILVFGAVLVMITPFGAGTDEETHFARIWEMSRGVLIPNQYLSTGPYYPFTFYQISYRQDVNENPVSWEAWKAQLSLKISWDDMLNYNIRARYFPTFYLPQAFIMGVLGRVLDTPVAFIYYIERFSYLFIYVILIYLAIRIAPIGKWLFGVLSIMPMSLILASTVSADSMNNGFVFLFIAWVLYMNSAQKSPVFSRKEWWITALLTLAMCTLKLNALPLLLLIFLIPRNKLGPQKWFIAFIIFALLSVLVVGMGWNYITSSFLLNTGANDTYSAMGQLAKIFADPLHFIDTLATSIFTQAPGYLRAWIGVSGYDYWVLPALVYWLAPLLILAAVLNEGITNFFNRKKRIFLWITFVIVFVGTWILFYLLYDTVPGTQQISGVQGRYFIILGPVLMLPLLPARVLLNIKKIWLQVGAILIAVMTVGALFLVYHVSCGSAYYTPGLCVLPKYKNWSPQTSLSQTIAPSTTVRQTFVPACNDVSQIGLWVKQKRTSPDPLLVEIQADDSPDPVMSKIVSQEEIPSSGWLIIDFPAVTNLMKKNLTIEVTPASVQGNPLIDLGYSSTNEYLNGSLTIQNLAQDGDLLFRYGCRAGLENLFH